MRKNNPACYECPKGKNKLHHWIKTAVPPKGAVCLCCELQLSREDAECVGFDFSGDQP